MIHNYLDKIPSRSEKYDWEVDEHQEVTILVENKGPLNRIAQMFLKKPKFSQVQLEEVGSFIWFRMDGKRSVNEIAQLMQQELGEEAEQLDDRLVRNLQTLKSHGFIQF
jgi:hypothetical protein